jgi:hypothetical protein
MSPGVNGSSLMPREMVGKAAASALNVAARRLGSPGAEAEEPAARRRRGPATGRSVLGGQLPRWGRWWNLRGTSQGAGRTRPGTKPGAADRAERAERPDGLWLDGDPSTGPG